MITIPYMKGVPEAVERHEIATTVRPYKTLCQCLVHPKDKRSVQESAGVVYSIPYKDCPMVYNNKLYRRDW